MDDAQQLSKKLKSHGYSLTNSRQLIFQVLASRETQTMAELVAACAGKLDRATVYRTIALFETIGIVQRLQIGWKYKLELTAAFSHHHHHLTCQHCGITLPISEDAALENRLHALAKQHGFMHTDHQIEVRGLCARCQASHPVTT